MCQVDKKIYSVSPMRKVFFTAFLLLSCIWTIFAQFDTQFSQYMFNQTAFNPAAVGEGGMIQVIGQHRLQWVGMPNGGRTTVFSINSPLKLGDSFNGIGFKFFNDKVGGFVNQTAHLEYAYKKHLGDAVLSVGSDVGFVSLGFNGDSVKAHAITLGDYHDLTNDPSIPQTNISGMSFDMNIGANYSTPTFYAGVSYSHLNRPVIVWNDRSEISLKGTLFLSGGYNFVLPDSKYVFKPSGLFKTNFNTWQLDLTSRLEYDNKYWGGMSYRIQDAVVLLAGINIAGGFSIGYSYDLPTSKIINASWGSHEILLVYSFDYVFNKRNTKYKSVRIL